MVKIRLKRMGTTKRPVYRLVVADSRSPRDGRFIEAIGFYDPLPDPAVVRIDAEKVRTWMRRGARPTESARLLLAQQGIVEAPARRGPAPSPQKGPAPAPVGAETDSPPAGAAASADSPAAETAAPAEAQIAAPEESQ